MGLMTLIARKINLDRSQPQPRAPPYERKTSAKSPVRLVQTVSSNPSVSGASNPATPKIHLTAPRAQDNPSPPLSQASSKESAAPAPVVLGFRGDYASSRPHTSHGKDPAPSPSLDPPPTPKLSRLSLLVTPRQRVSVRKPSNTRPGIAPSEQPTAPSHKARTSISSSTFTRSARSDVGGKGYVDLLDAQSEVRPSDFHSRVRAAGARDYGEDVADRNIGANGCNLDSKAVQEFYADHQHRPVSSWSRPRNFSDGEMDNLHRLSVSKQMSIDAALWSKLLNESDHADEEHEDVPPLLAAAALERKHVKHRQTMTALTYAMPRERGAYEIPGLGDDSDAAHTARAQQRLLERKKAARRSLQMPLRSTEHTSPWDTTSHDSDGDFPAPMVRPSRALGRSVSSADRRRGISASSKRDCLTLAGYGSADELPKFAINNQPILSPQPMSFHRSASLAYPHLTPSSKRPSTAHGRLTTRRTHDPMFDLHGTLPDLSSLSHPLAERAGAFRDEWNGDLSDRESAPSPFIKTTRVRSTSRENAREYFRPAGVTTPQPRSQAGESEDLTPGHTNSIRHWSMASTAPTTSSSSSATYGRPLSRHTADTSIDLNSTGSATALDPSLDSVVNSDILGKNSLTISHLASNFKKTSEADQSLPLSMDDYGSSDEDSFLDGSLSRGESEEDLLFGRGYGAKGIQLPGLEDSFAAPAPTIPLRSPRLMAESKPKNDEFSIMERFEHWRKASDEAVPVDDLKKISHMRQRSVGTAELSSPKKKLSIETHAEAQHTPRRAETPRRFALTNVPINHASPQASHSHSGVLGRNSMRYHPHPSHHLHHHGINVGDEVIEEEKFEKIDIAAAVRLRKESKSRKRASMAGMASQSRGRGLVSA